MGVVEVAPACFVLCVIAKKRCECPGVVFMCVYVCNSRYQTGKYILS